MFKELAMAQRRLLISIFLFGLASPMVVLYANTFLWRHSQDPIILAIFNIGSYAGIFIGFFLNAYLLRMFQSGRLYTLGCILQGIVPILLIALGAQANTYVLPLGLALGIAKGFFWANRNALTSKITQGPHRYQFVSLETALSITAGIISPLLIGWFIVFGDTHSSYTIEQAYQITSVVGFILLIAAGSFAWSYTMEPFTPKQFLLRQVSIRWKKQRLIEMINGIASGIESILPLIIILLFLGQEEAVGTVKALTSALSAGVIYSLGKRIKHTHHTLLFGLWMSFNFMGSLWFALFYSPEAALTFFILSGLVGSLRWSSFVSVMYEVVDEEIEESGHHRVLYLLDREFFLNVGRILGLGLLIMLYLYSHELLVRYGLLIVVVIQIPTVFLLQQMTQSLKQQV
ncbi:hypothetical protein HQ487_01620 [Candidatus Uhrbacteria bacterium]|nr:hypothetical protein [Candidatus Uhrbacteria bacterium]